MGDPGIALGVPDPAALLRLAERLAADAAAVLRSRPEQLVIDTKSTPTDAVTAMDRAAERVVLDGLSRHRPGDPVVAEESGSRPGDGSVVWHVDPLDGTVNYIYSRPAFAVTIAAVVDGVTVAGVVHDVALDLAYTATVDGPALRNGHTIGCNDPAEPAQALIATGFSYSAEARALQATVLASLLPKVRDVRRTGSAALDLCAVASGLADGYYEEGANSWDWLAAELIVQRAGGATARLDEGITGKEFLAAAGLGLLPKLLRLLSQAGVPGAESALPSTS